MPHRLWFHQVSAIEAKLTPGAALSRLLPDRPHLPFLFFGDTTLPGSRLALSVGSTLDVANANKRKNTLRQGLGAARIRDSYPG
jgi:hypothetical protein